MNNRTAYAIGGHSNDTLQRVFLSRIIHQREKKRREIGGTDKGNSPSENKSIHACSQSIRTGEWTIPPVTGGKRSRVPRAWYLAAEIR